MKTILKYTTAAILAGAVALSMASPSQARHGRNAAAIGGFIAGAAIGAAVANSNNGYYYNQPGYAYQPGYEGYAYQPNYDYDVAARPAYPFESAPRYYRRSTGRCGGSPSSPNYRPCGN